MARRGQLHVVQVGDAIRFYDAKNDQWWYQFGRKYGQANALYHLGIGLGLDGIVPLDDALDAVRDGYDMAARRKAASSLEPAR